MIYGVAREVEGGRGKCAWGCEGAWVCEGAWGCVGRAWGVCVGQEKWVSLAPLYYPDTLVNPDTCLGYRSDINWEVKAIVNEDN